MPRETVLFACIENAGRSQMAAAFFNALAEPSAARALSAGSEPAERVHPAVEQVMRELGIELGATRPHRLTGDLVARADVLITMGCGEACPVVPGVPREDWVLPDPKDQPLERVRDIRDRIRARVEALIARSGWDRRPPSV